MKPIVKHYIAVRTDVGPQPFKSGVCFVVCIPRTRTFRVYEKESNLSTFTNWAQSKVIIESFVSHLTKNMKSASVCVSHFKLIRGFKNQYWLSSFGLLGKKLSSHRVVLKSDNLQYNTLGRWDDRLIDQASDVPSIIFFSWFVAKFFA